MNQLSIQIKNHYNYHLSIKIIFKDGKIDKYQGVVVNPPASFWNPHLDYTNSNLELLIVEIGRALESSIEQQEKV